MADICSICGLPKEICVCQEIQKEGQRIKIYVMKIKFGKYVTIVEGISGDETLKSVNRELKRRLACGGTTKEGRIELQGAQKGRAKEALVTIGYDGSMIDVK